MSKIRSKHTFNLFERFGDLMETKGYVVKYVRISKLKDLLKDGEISIRVASDAKPKVAEVLDNAVADAIKELIKKLPRISRGPNAGKLDRITIQAKDFEPDTIED